MISTAGSWGLQARHSVSASSRCRATTWLTLQRLQGSTSCWQQRCFSQQDSNAQIASGPASPGQPLASGLYLVGTPIGNLEGATAILAEDTRHTRKLLTHFSIGTPLHSFHAHNEHTKEAIVMQHLAQGAALALVSDAGMPLVSDPGAALVSAAAAAGHRVIPIPGPSAFLTALVASGLPTGSFAFRGFLPDKRTQRQAALQEAAELQCTTAFYVPPHDLQQVLADMLAIMGPDRKCTVARELTKVHEEFFRGTLAEAAARFQAVPAKGEVTLIVEGATVAAAEIVSDEGIQAELKKLIRDGHSLSVAAKLLSGKLGVPRKRIYGLAIKLQQN